MATIYTFDGDVVADGLQGCTVCSEAIDAAERIANERGEAVELCDDDGEWLIYPAAADGTREYPRAIGVREQERRDYEEAESAHWAKYG